MVIVGVDVHKRTHTFVAVSQTGRQLGARTVAATTAGHEMALRWATAAFGTDLVWGIEDCRTMSVRLERDLLAAGQTVLRVPPMLMAQTRASARTAGKSDPIDALAVARAVLREPDLPRASHDAASRECRLLTDRRETLVAQRTASLNSLLWRVHELDPEHHIASRSLNRLTHQHTLKEWLDGQSGLIAELAREELNDIIALTARINDYERRITALVEQIAPRLLAIPGCGPLSAAKLVGETAGITRFPNDAAFARYAGVAPVPVWSGTTAGRVRMTRSGNRQINAALHRIAITQTRLTDSLGHAYYDRKRTEGKTTREALRCLKRRLAVLTR